MNRNQLIFTPGPVKEYPEISELGGLQTPYFRNQAFSDVVLETEQQLLQLANAPKGSRAVLLTASGTAAMEAAVLNLIAPKHKTVSVISGGFGQRFADICRVHQRQHSPYHPEFDDDLSDTSSLTPFSDHDALLINGHETSICHRFNLDKVGQFCHENQLLHIVDAISMFLTDELDMQSQHIDALIVSSQKALALPPGVAIIILSPKAIAKLLPEPASLYFNLTDYLRDGERGQTPYTPAVSIILQLHQRLLQIASRGGLKAEIAKTKEVAQFFRKGIAKLPLTFFSTHMANSVTGLSPTDGTSATQLVKEFEARYQMVLCPNGGELADTLFRVSHMGNITIQDTQLLLDALHDYFGVNQ